MAYEQLLLSNQLCFPVYAASRLIIREYQPFLDKLGITYPQYLVLLVLWENGECTVNDIAGRLILNTNTLTPLLKRMEAQKLVTRERSTQDERKVLIKPTEKALGMQDAAAEIPLQLAGTLNGEQLDLQALIQLKESLNQLIGYLNKNDKGQQPDCTGHSI